jgi:hypothetical protein
MPVSDGVSVRPKKTAVVHISVDKAKATHVKPQTTNYYAGQLIPFFSDCAVYLAFDNYDVFNMDGLFLEADQVIELAAKYPYETSIHVSVEEKQVAGAPTPGGRVLMNAYCADPPKIVPGE